MSTCDICAHHNCRLADNPDLPAACQLAPERRDQVIGDYQQPDDYEIMSAANAVIVASGKKMSRVEETMTFARELGARKIGVAFCIALDAEARVFCRMLRSNGFDVEAVICKKGALPKSSTSAVSQGALPVAEGELPASSCNPIAQAQLMNEAGCDLNVILGLCVGHDTVFVKHSDAPVTFLAAKDFATDHDPLLPLHQDEAFARLYDLPLPDGPTWR